MNADVLTTKVTEGIAVISSGQREAHVFRRRNGRRANRELAGICG